MKLRSLDSDKMEVLYPGNLALLSMFLKNPETDKGEIKTDEGKRGENLLMYNYFIVIFFPVLCI